MKYKGTPVLFSLFSIVLVLFISCNQTATLSDPQGNTYATVRIGDQVWMAQNLRYAVETGSYCYNDDSIRCLEMGRLYTWDAAMIAANDIQGWQLPKKDDWIELIEYCGGDSTAYKQMISEETGFNPQWSGVRVYTGEYKSAGLGVVNYWTSSITDIDTLAWSFAILSKYETITAHKYGRSNACNVRLIKKQ